MSLCPEGNRPAALLDATGLLSPTEDGGILEITRSRCQEGADGRDVPCHGRLSRTMSRGRTEVRATVLPSRYRLVGRGPLLAALDAERRKAASGCFRCV